ncbi:NAD(P)H-hydrate dehydratase [bacterium]|nr:NAD(P)H-hydrate dehydratase [bacterium]
MRPIVVPDQMRDLDRRTIEDVGLPGIVLMELAARGVMLEIEQLLGGNVAGAHALVFVGPGNNGGDGFAIARRLLNAGCEVAAYVCTPLEKISGDARTNMDIYQKLGGAITVIEEPRQLSRLPHAHIIIDALLGTGMNGAPRGIIADAIEAINKSGTPVVAVDIPSGVNGATGATEGAAVMADVTATFGEIKVGHLIPPGIDHSGRISRVDIQIPPQFVHEMDIPLFFIEPGDVYEMMPVRPMGAHKGDFGKVLVVAGSVGMTGAAELAGRSVLRSGAGMVKVATAKSAQAILAGGGHAEIMTIPVAESGNGAISEAAETTIDDARTWADVEVIGPGLTMNPETVAWFAEHALDLPLPTVIDADGLNALAERTELLGKLGENVVLTPHVGEFARLTGLSIDEIEANRVETVKKFAREWGCTILLKGVPTLVAGPSGPAYCILAGNPGMASAGMGDVLTGTIAGLLAQGLNARDAAIAGTTIHGLAGNLAADELGSSGIVAGDVVERLGLATDIVAGRAALPRSGGGGCGCGSGGCGDGGCDDGDCGCGGGSCNC